MSKDTSSFLKFVLAVFLPAFVAGLLLPVMKGLEMWLFILWLVTTLLAIGYAVDGGRGAKDLLTGTFSAWGLTVIAGLLTWLLVAAKIGHSL